MLFHSLSYKAMLPTEWLNHTVPRSRFYEVVDCAPFLLKLFVITELHFGGLISTHIQSCLLRYAVLARLSGGAAALGSLVTGSVEAAWHRANAYGRTARSTRTGLQLENDCPTSNIGSLPLRPAAS